jgi:hypothetical protein
VRDALLRPERLQFGQREVFGKPPSIGTPSIVLPALRAANSGRSATSVVLEISFSWRATNTPSLVITRSGSM